MKNGKIRKMHKSHLNKLLVLKGKKCDVDHCSLLSSGCLNGLCPFLGAKRCCSKIQCIAADNTTTASFSACS